MRKAYSGRARVSIRRPEAMAECDRSGQWYSLSDMVKQYQWGAYGLYDTGLLVGFDQVDVPQEQFRTPILPPDPRPRVNPRPSYNTTPIALTGQPLPTTPSNQGFTQYTLGAPGTPGLWPSVSQSAVLAAVLSNAGVTAPAGLLVNSQGLSSNASTWLIGEDSTRTFLLLYNPTASVVQIALASTIASGAITNLSIGPGEAYFWSTSQGLGTVYQGSVAAISAWGGNLPLWFWTDGTGFWDDGGVLAFRDIAAAAGWPTSSAGLLPGQVWNNGLTVALVLPVAPSPSAPAVILGGITAPQFLALGGGNLPTSPPPDGSLQLWNNGGVLCVS